MIQLLNSYIGASLYPIDGAPSHLRRSERQTGGESPQPLDLVTEMYRQAKTEVLNEQFLEPVHDDLDELTPQPLGVIERLKDQFGDYSDPLTYDWTWWDTD